MRAQFWHTNTVENYFSIFKRAVFGCYFHVSEAHLHRYAAERDFMHNHRERLGFDDQDGPPAPFLGSRLAHHQSLPPPTPLPSTPVEGSDAWQQTWIRATEMTDAAPDQRP